MIHPGMGVGPFRLGSSIGAVLALLQAQPAILRGQPSKLISSPTLPARVDLTLELPALGLRLRFDAHYQRLHLIEHVGGAAAPLYYMRSPLSASALGGPQRPRQRKQTQPQQQDGKVMASADAPSFAQLYALFGPTFPGAFDAQTCCYTLQYPGLALEFRLPDGPPSDAERGEVLLADGSSPPLSRLLVHGGTELASFASCVPPPLSSSVDAACSESMTVLLGRGGGLWLERRGVLVSFESRAQDLLSDLGPPQHIYVKQRHGDKMSIHRASGSTTSSPLIQSRQLMTTSPTLAACSESAGSDASSPACDYFFNYFLLGLDVLLDGLTHRVKKMVLHTNFVEGADFGTYARAHFSIPAPGSLTGVAANGIAAASVPLGQTRGMLSLLELPPAAAGVAQPTSAARSLSGNHSGGNGANTSSNSNADAEAEQARRQSVSQQANSGDISLHVPSADSETSGGKKKKKKGGAANAAAAADKLAADDALAAANNAVMAAVQSKQQQQQSGASPLSGVSPSSDPASASPPRQFFSPSLSPSVLPASSATSIGPLSQWSDVLAVLGPCPTPKPMISATGAASGGARTNSSSSTSTSRSGRDTSASPFGPTYFYAYPGVIFEVMKNHHLASLTLFECHTD